jgi:hypothetical protein
MVHNENKGIGRDGEQKWILSVMKTNKALGTLLGLLGSLPAFLFLPLAANLRRERERAAGATGGC